jgi:uncharacterized protein YndB with AHSA1/START domain
VEAPRASSGARGLLPVTRMALSPLAHSVVVDAPRDEAFRIFTAQLGDWWPLAYTFSEAAFADAVVEPRVGGRWLERDQDGREHPWGDVVTYDPGRRLVLKFGIGPDRQPVPRDRSSEVEVRFEPAGGGAKTRVEIEHRGFECHGEGADALRVGLDSPRGWPLILAELRRGVRRAERT